MKLKLKNKEKEQLINRILAYGYDIDYIRNTSIDNLKDILYHLSKIG